MFLDWIVFDGDQRLIVDNECANGQKSVKKTSRIAHWECQWFRKKFGVEGAKGSAGSKEREAFRLCWSTAVFIGLFHSVFWHCFYRRKETHLSWKFRSARVFSRGSLLAGRVDVRVPRWFLVRWSVDVISRHVVSPIRGEWSWCTGSSCPSWEVSRTHKARMARYT